MARGRWRADDGARGGRLRTSPTVFALSDSTPSRIHPQHPRKTSSADNTTSVDQTWPSRASPGYDSSVQPVEPFLRATQIPNAVSKEAYAAWLAEQWAKLLAREDELLERDYHKFLAANPCMVPGFKGRPLDAYYPGWQQEAPNAALFHHGPIKWVMHTQPPLDGFFRRIPDFMWINTHSAGACAVLVEIERPSKRWFGKNRETSRELRQALDQLRDWKAWFEELGHRESFCKRYGVPADYLRHYSFDVQFVLVYGVRSEFADDMELNRLRRHIAPSDVTMMTFDRIYPDLGAMDCVTVRTEGDRHVVAAVPPTYRFHRYLLATHGRFPGLAKALAGCELMPPERRNFLRERLPYWRSWLRRNGGKFDFEQLPPDYRE